MSIGIVLVFTGAVFVSVFGFLGSTIAMSMTGRACAGVATEKPELFGKLLLLQSLPGSQGIFALVGAFLILIFSGILGGEGTEITVSKGAQYLLASIPLGLIAFFSSIHQGKVAVAGISMVAKDETQLAKAIVFAAMIETWSIFGLLMSIILLISIK